jgi:hypothetical protein
MDPITLSTALAIATISYGEVVDGQPNWTQRELHVYTNFARVAPEDWESEYDCSLNEFTSDERVGKAPLFFHDGLTSIAQSHSDDMNSHDFMSHDSSNGTDFGSRVWPWYDGVMIAENVAMGYADNWEVVFEGWMCSAGHRENIMASDLEDIGTGVAGLSYTQDFGAGAGTMEIQVAMGVHYPEAPSREVDFFATWEDDAAPTGFWVETAADCLDLDRIAGTSDRGAWSVEAQSEGGCAAYRFLWETEGGIRGTLPESGAYQYGAGCDEWISSEPTGCEVAPDDDSGGPDGEGSGGGDGPSDDSSDETDDDGGEGGSDTDGDEDDERTRSSHLCGDTNSESCIDEDKDEVKNGCSTVTQTPDNAAWFLLLAALVFGPRRQD